MMNKLMKKTMLLGTTAIIIGTSFIPVTAFAEDNAENAAVESDLVKMSFGDGILKAEVPENEGWKEVKDEDNCVMITDGANMIIFNHYDNLDDLPKIASFDQEHEMTYEVSFSKSDISVTLVGEIAHTEDYASVKKIIDNIEIDLSKLGPDHVHDKHQLNKEEFSVRDVNYTAWVSAADGLCIRDNGSATAAYITTEAYGTALTVTGEVLKNGLDTGWRRVTDGRGITGYCSGQFLSLNEIVVKKEEPKKDISNYPNTVAIFCAGDLRYVYLCSNGQYTDNDGNVYDASADFMTFVRVNDGLTYHEARSLGYDPDTWFGTEEPVAEEPVVEEPVVEEPVVEAAADEFFGPQSVDIYCAGDLRHVEYYGDGKYIDEEGNLYTALASCTTFVRDCDGVTYYTAEAAGIDVSEW